MIRQWLKFFRVVNLPTVPGDVWVGAVAVWFGAGMIVDYGCTLYNATIAAGFIYLFGLADNDIVGAKTDVGRPIPDGMISLRAAKIARAACLLATVAIASVPDIVSGLRLPGCWRICAALLLVSIVVYNRRKWWWLMGLCRGLNVLCGGMVALAPLLTYPDGCVNATWLGVAALVWTIYIAAVTKYSEGEEMDAAKKRRVGFLVGGIMYLQIIALLLFQSGIVVLVAVLLVAMRMMKRLWPEVSAS